ncbi:MAG: serine/threonine-protein kinase [Myxococcota bacterium]
MSEAKPEDARGDRSSTSRKQSLEPDPLIGRVINDRFRIVSLVARGGMGKVYRAEQAPLGREVALKILHPKYRGEHDPEFHKRFFLEASICSKLTHPNTVTIFDYGRTDDEVYYIAMELLEGRTLHRALREEARIPAERAMHIARQICRSLREAHSLGVIHRDLKPANIFLLQHGDEKDFVKVLDFGLVKDMREQGEDLTQTGLFMGSPKYMSPEQISGEPVDSRSDVYSLGVILYEMLTGKVPFDRPNSVNILMAHVHENPPPMSELAPEAVIDIGLETIVMRCMAKEPDSRFRSMDELLIALKQVASASGLAVSRSGELALSGEMSIGGGATGSFNVVPPASSPPSAPPSPPSVHSSPSSIMPPIVADPSLEADAPRRNRSAVAFVVVSLLLAIGVGAFFALRERAARVNRAQITVPETTPIEDTVEEIVEPAPEVVAAPERVMISLRSEPAGAIVVVGEREYGPTPAEVEITGDQAAAGEELTFQFQLDGYRDFTVTRTITTETLDVRASLEPASMRPTRMVRRPPRPRTPMTRMTVESGASVGLKGYKAEPY